VGDQNLTKERGLQKRAIERNGERRKGPKKKKARVGGRFFLKKKTDDSSVEWGIPGRGKDSDHRTKAQGGQTLPRSGGDDTLGQKHRD